MKREIKLKKLKLSFDQGRWFSAEYYEDGILKLGEGCHFSQKQTVAEIKAKFLNLRGI